MKINNNESVARKCNKKVKQGVRNGGFVVENYDLSLFMLYLPIIF